MKHKAMQSEFQTLNRDYKAALKWMIIFICASVVSLAYIVILTLFAGDAPERVLWIIVLALLCGFGLFAASALYLTGVRHANPTKLKGQSHD